MAELGDYLKSRRAVLRPADVGLTSTGVRRVPGLRREEVAQRANISATWYTWLEQGRGGAPSAEVLDRVAGALMLTEAEREQYLRTALSESQRLGRLAQGLLEYETLTGEEIGKVIRGEALGGDDDTPPSAIPSVPAIPRVPPAGQAPVPTA